MSDKKASLLLYISSPRGEEKRFLEGDEFIVGRSPDVQVSIVDPLISRAHFKMYAKSGGLWLTDLGSTNGTFLNNQQVKKGYDQAVQNGDVIKIGKSEYRFEVQELQVSQAGIPQSVSIEANSSLVDDHFPSVAEPQPAVAKPAPAVSMPKPAMFEPQKIQPKAFVHPTEPVPEDIQKKIHRLLDEAQLKAAEIVSEAHKQAEVAVQNVYTKADQYRLKTKDEADKLAQAAELKMDQTLSHSQKLAQGILDDSRAKAHEMRTKAHEDSERMIDEAESFVENLKAQAQKEIEESRQKKIQQMDQEFAEEKKMVLNELVENAKLDQLQMIKETEDRIEKLENDAKAGIERLNQQIFEKQKAFDELADVFARRESELQADLMAKMSAMSQQLDQEFELHKNQLESSKIDLEKKTSLALQDFEKNDLQLKALIQTISDKQKALGEMDSHFEDASAKFEKVRADLVVLEKNFAVKDGEYKKLFEDKNRIEAEFKLKMENLEKNYLQTKSRFDSDFKKHQEGEENRLSEWVKKESAELLKMKEESLRLVLDLETTLTKELSLSTEKVFAGNLPEGKMQQLNPELEKAFKSTIQNRVLKLLQGQETNDGKLKHKTVKSNPDAWKPLSIGFAVSAALFGFLPWAIRYAQNEGNPVQSQIEDQAEMRKQDLERRKFNPTKTAEVRSSLTDSVLYTNNFVETYKVEAFRSGLMKEGSVYLYKSLKIEEEKAIQTFSMISSLIEGLNEKREKIHPDFIKSDIEKMHALETESLKKMKDILGTEVRVEAALKFQARYFKEFNAQRGLAAETPTK